MTVKRQERGGKVVCVHIIYSPLPEERNAEESASFAYARRARDRILHEAAAASPSASPDDGDRPAVEIFLLKDYLSSSVSSPSASPASDRTTTEDVRLLLLSCGRDGSTDRAVRQWTRRLREEEQEAEAGAEETTAAAAGASSPAGKTTAVPFDAVALLGHAVCRTSSEQMADEIFGPGRKLARRLVASTTADVLEVQVELAGPEEEFDGWLSERVTRRVVAAAAAAAKAVTSVHEE